MKKAFEHVKKANIRIESVKAASEIAEQPVGHSETIKGASNRLSTNNILLCVTLKPMQKKTMLASTMTLLHQ